MTKNGIFWGNRRGILQVAQHYRDGGLEIQTKPRHIGQNPSLSTRLQAAGQNFCKINDFAAFTTQNLFHNGAQNSAPELAWCKMAELFFNRFHTHKFVAKKFQQMRPICWQKLSPQQITHL